MKKLAWDYKLEEDDREYGRKLAWGLAIFWAAAIGFLIISFKMLT